MYRTKEQHAADDTFRAELYLAPSTKDESRAVLFAAAYGNILWALCYGAWFFKYDGHPSSSAPSELTTIVLGFSPILFTPALPLRTLVRRFLIGGRRRRIEGRFFEGGVEWDGHGIKLDRMKGVRQSLTATIEPDQHLVIATTNDGSLFSIRVPDEHTAARLAKALCPTPAYGGELTFRIRRDPLPRMYGAWGRASLLLLWSLIVAVVAISLAIEPWSVYIVYFIIFIPAIGGTLVFLPMSWFALLGKESVATLRIDDPVIFINSDPVCSIDDKLHVRIDEGPSLTLNSAAAGCEERIIKPWLPGDRHELELIKATIDALRRA